MKALLRKLAAKALEAMVTALGEEAGKAIARRISPDDDDDDDDDKECD